ncbi:hypothetical protein ACTOB_008495 [Actinoplanes oblitus]|uniref:Nitrate/nitrite sensing protein domain-containing protein n=1 Tax=Actinoplanes oblitus TaxID=3040509 RepID=A0ABY8WEM8_9ACTN|nr:hypothetical protein [Actinoplanes oblitus]WIM96306.1 hypothetical protein ACTOB_008495 [Actinoplanes oblitus]
MLTALVLLPAAGLFLRVLQENSKQRDNTTLEQQGVEYLTALSTLVSALAESQSSALQGVAAEPASVTAAVSRVQGVDERLGDDLETKTRWADLKDKISKLPKVTGTAEQIFEAHVEVADLTLEMYDLVAENSTLAQDDDNDIWFLQEAVTVRMPESVTAVSRMSDLAAMAAGAKKAQKQLLTVRFGYQALQVQDSVDEVTDSLQEAVDSTNSDTLSGNLVSNLDSFRRGIEAANRGANLGGGAPNASTLVTAQSTLQTALSALSGVVLKEIAGLLDDRMDTLNYKRIEAYGMFGVAVVLIVVATFWTRGRAREVRAALAQQPGEGSRDVSVQSAGSYDSTYGDIPNYGGGRERTGALR